jgi:hypothetical protein
MSSNEWKYEFIVRPPSTRRHVEEVMRGINTTTGIKYEIQVRDARLSILRGNLEQRLGRGS